MSFIRGGSSSLNILFFVCMTCILSGFMIEGAPAWHPPHPVQQLLYQFLFISFEIIVIGHLNDVKNHMCGRKPFKGPGCSRVRVPGPITANQLQSLTFLNAFNAVKCCLDLFSFEDLTHRCCQGVL